MKSGTARRCRLVLRPIPGSEELRWTRSFVIIASSARPPVSSPSCRDSLHPEKTSRSSICCPAWGQAVRRAFFWPGTSRSVASKSP